jgi:DNA-binding GntR family transcriptional regulator
VTRRRLRLWLFDTLFRKITLKMRRAERSLAAVSATLEQAQLLGIAENAPLIPVGTVGFTTQEEQVEYYPLLSN